jgi:hypothetical protein
MRPAELWIDRAVGIAFAASFLWHVVKTFGWEGIALKFALAWDGLAVLGIGIFAGRPFLHLAGKKLAASPAGLCALAVLLMAEIACGYAVLSDRPTRWLIDRPAVKWPLYITALLVVVRIGIGGRWLPGI